MSTRYLPFTELIEAIAYSPAGLVAIGGKRDASGAPTSIHVAKLPTFEHVVSFPIGPAATALEFVGDILVAGDASGNLHAFSLSANSPVNQQAAHVLHQGAIRCLQAVGDSYVASVGDDGVLKIVAISANGFGLASEQNLSDRALRSLAFDPQRSLIAAGGDDGIVRSLSSAAGETEMPVREMDMGEAVFSLAFVDDGRIAAGCADGSLRIAYLEGAADAENRSKGALHDGPIHGLIFTAALFDQAERPLPRRLISISADGSIKAWQLDTKRKPPTTQIAKGALSGAVLAPASAQAASDVRGGTLIIGSRDRLLSTIAVDEKGVPSGSIERVYSRLNELSNLLTAKKDAVRFKACASLEELPENRARELLDSALSGDKSADVRKAAAAAIGRGDRRLSRPTLRTALNDNDAEVRAAALEALRHIERETPVAAARAALASKHEDVRASALKRLPSLRESSPLVPTLIAESLGDASQVVRFAALDALYVLESENPLAAARTAISRGPEDIREEVLLRIGRSRLAADGDGALLLENAFDDEHEVVRTTALLTSIAALPGLRAAIEKADEHTAKAIANLEKNGSLSDGGQTGKSIKSVGEADRKPLFAALASRAPDTALRGARLLALLGDSRSVGALLQLSREPDPALRRHLLEALFRAVVAIPSDGRTLDRMRSMTSDEDETVRQAAVDSLLALAEADGAEAELALANLALRSGDADVRLRALPLLVRFASSGKHAALAELTPRADELLGDALGDENEKVRDEAFRTLWEWQKESPQAVLERGATSPQAGVRRRVVKELEHQKGDHPSGLAVWADALMLRLVTDPVSAVGLDAFNAATKSDEGKARLDVHLAALRSPAPIVRTGGLKSIRGATKLQRGVGLAGPEVVASTLNLVSDANVAVHTAAIETMDRIAPEHAEAFALALDSIYFGLRVRAMELCGRRRDDRCAGPAKAFLQIPETHLNRPTPELRQRASSAIADLGSAALQDFYIQLLTDDDPIVREMAARGLATASVPGDEETLALSLGHADLPVRSWIAEGLARLGDERALAVLAGTLVHDHLPIRRGAIMGFTALGPDGVSGLIKGLEDDKREIADLVFAIIVARDLALAEAGESPDLLWSALSAKHAEIRFAAARILETRGKPAHREIAAALVGPTPAEKASDNKKWPDSDAQATRLKVLVDALASDHPQYRYAAAQVLALRPQPLAFWREAKTLLGPSSRSRPRIPFTSWDGEEKTPRKRGWIRSLAAQPKSSTPSKPSGPESGQSVASKLLGAFGKFSKRKPDPASSASATPSASSDASVLAFGAYAGLVRQAPVAGAADETHRVRRDSVARLAELSKLNAIGTDAVLPVLRRALSDPNHLVRRAAVAAVRSLYPEDSSEPLILELASDAADVGRGAVDELIERASNSERALALAKESINAPVSEVRSYALGKLPQLFESGSIDPWLLALDARHADVRLAVVDRLVDSSDERVITALARAMESDHEDLRLRAATALAARGDIRTVDVLGALLFSEDSEWDAAEALSDLASSRNDPAAAKAAALAITHRLENDPDETADHYILLDALESIASPAAAEFLVGQLIREPSDDDESGGQTVDAATALKLLSASLRERKATNSKTQRQDSRGNVMPTFVSVAETLTWASQLASAKVESLRIASCTDFLRYLSGRETEEVLEELLGDRSAGVRVAAAEALAYRAENIEGASIGALRGALRDGKRELVLPAAEGLAARGAAEAFQALLLVFKAGDQSERKRAVLAMGALGDKRALDELEPFVQDASELEPEDAELLPAIVTALARLTASLEGADRERVRALVENVARESATPLRKSALYGLRLSATLEGRVFIESIAADARENQDVRREAIAQLGRLGDPASETTLSELVRSSDRQIAFNALASLEAIFPDDKTRTHLFALLSADRSMRESAASYLSWFGNTETLVEKLTSIDDSAARARLRQGLIRRGSSPTAILKTMLSSESIDDRNDAAWIAGAAAAADLKNEIRFAADRAAVAYRTVVSKHGSGDKRSELAMQAWLASLWAAERTTADVSESAMVALEDSSLPSKLRAAAARALTVSASISTNEEFLRTLLSDVDASVRGYAAEALATSAPGQASSNLKSPIASDVAALRPLARAAIRSGQDVVSDDTTRRLVLDQIIGEREVNALSGALASPSEALTAVAALGRMGGEAAEATLEKMAKTAEQDEVRAASYRALRRLQRRAERQRVAKEGPSSQ